MKWLVPLLLCASPAFADEDWAARCAERLQEAAKSDASFARGAVEAFHYDRALADGRWRWFDVDFRIDLADGSELSAVALADETTRSGRADLAFRGADLATDGAPAALAHAFAVTFQPALDDCRRMAQ